MRSKSAESRREEWGTPPNPQRNLQSLQLVVGSVL
jgi:hypothetical protein